MGRAKSKKCEKVGRMLHMYPYYSKSLYMSFNEANYDILPENITGLSIFSITIEFPSTGDLTIPTICRFCSHGALLFNRTLANLAAHFERPCL